MYAIHTMYVCTYMGVPVPPSPQGETVVDLVDEEHSKDFEELKAVAEAAQGVSAGWQVSHCHPPLSSSESLSFCCGYIRTTCV